MNRVVRIFFLVSVALIAMADLCFAAQPKSESEPLVVTFIFRVNSAEIDLDYMDNAANMDSLRREARVGGDISRIRLIAQSSPEGPMAYNDALAARRGQTLEWLVMELFPTVERADISKIVSTAYWQHGARSYDKERLARMRLGQVAITFREPQAPQAEIVPEPVSVPEAALQELPLPSATEEAILTTIKRPRAMTWALKTNMLFDAVGAINIGAEVMVHPRISVQADLAYSFWRTKVNLAALQTQQGGIGAKYWFKRKNDRALTGWNAGIYLTAGRRFDVQLTDGYQGDRFWSAGASAGYGLKIARSLNLEFALAAGYFRTPELRHYHRPEQGHLMWQNTRSKFGTFSLTKIQANLVWLICK